MKTTTTKSKNTPVADVNVSYIEETLKLFESEEMRQHVRDEACKWSWPSEDCAEIIFKAPVPLETKLSLLKLILKQSGLSDDDERLMYDPATLGRQILTALKGRDNCPGGTVFRVTFRISENYTAKSGDQRIAYGWREKICSTFNEALEYIKSRKAGNADRGIRIEEKGFDCDEVYCVDKLLPPEYRSKAYLRWLLNSDGDILYFDYPCFDESLNIEIPGILNLLPFTFKPGDIIIGDCRPFADVKRVLALDEGIHETCMFINEEGHVDVGLIYSNDFLSNPMKNYVPGLFRAKLYDGELTEVETPLGIVSSAIKDNPKLGDDIYRYVERCKGLTDDDEANRKLGLTNKGVLWAQLKNEFNL